MMTSIDSPLHHHPGLSSQSQILRSFWDVESASNLRIQRAIDPSPYFNFYVEECCHALHDLGRYVSVRSHQDILRIVKDLNQNLPRERIFTRLSEELGPKDPWTEDQIDRSIDLAARLLTMTGIGADRLPFGFSGHNSLEWTGKGLKDFLASYLGAPNVLGHDGIKLGKTFTARALHQTAGIEIVGTNNLADHLRLIDDDKAVLVFHYASFLEYNRRHNTILPSGLAEETLKTLAMLFPQSDSATKKWLSRNKHTAGFDQRIFQCGRLKTDDRQIEKFRFWHDRLVMLKQVYDDARPGNLAQLWNDRRNGVQWYTFWVAIVVFLLTFVFGLIQCIEGGMQVYVGYKQMNSLPRP